MSDQAIEARTVVFRTVLDGTTTFTTDRANKDGYRPNPSSPASAEKVIEEVRVGGEPWGETPLATCHTFMHLLFIASTDHMHSVRALVGKEATIYGAQVMARSVIEASAQLWWLSEPGLTLRERVGRSVLLRTRGLKSQAKALADMGADAVAVDAQRARLDEAYAEAVDLGYELNIHGKTGEVEGVRIEAPTTTRLVEELFAQEAGTQLGGALYAFWSGLSHSHGWALMQFFQMDDPKPGLVYGGMSPRVRLLDLDHAVSFSLYAYMPAFERYGAYMGWLDSHWPSWRLYVVKRMMERPD